MIVRESNLIKRILPTGKREKRKGGGAQTKSAWVLEILLQVVKLSGQQHWNHPRGKSFENLQSLLSLLLGKQAPLAAPISACTDTISLARMAKDGP